MAIGILDSIAGIAAIVAIVTAISKWGYPYATKWYANYLYNKAKGAYTTAKSQSNDETKKRKDLYNILDKLEKALRQTNDIEITEKAMELREKIRGDLQYKIRFYPLLSPQTPDALSRLVLKQNEVQDLFQFELGSLYRAPAKLTQINTNSKQKFIQKAEEILWGFKNMPKDPETICVLMLPTKLPGKYYLYGHFKPYLFTWDDIIGGEKSEKKLREYLAEDYKIAWANDAKITQSDDCSTIRISHDKNDAVITMDKKNEKVTLQIGDTVHILRVKTWDDIIGGEKIEKKLKSEKKLREYLSEDYEIAWVNDAKITQSNGGSILRISHDKNDAEITMDKKNEKATLEIGDMVHNLRVEKENDEVKIYKNSPKEGERWKFPEDKFWIMTTGHIKSILRDENTFLAFNLRVLQRCSVLAVVPGLEHPATRGCLFDFTQRLNDTIYLAECNFICEECRSKILNAKKIPEGRRTTFLDELDKWIESTTPKIQKVGTGSSFNIKAINGGGMRNASSREK